MCGSTVQSPSQASRSPPSQSMPSASNLPLQNLLCFLFGDPDNSSRPSSPTKLYPTSPTHLSILSPRQELVPGRAAALLPVNFQLTLWLSPCLPRPLVIPPPPTPPSPPPFRLWSPKSTGWVSSPYSLPSTIPVYIPTRPRTPSSLGKTGSHRHKRCQSQ